MVNLGEIEKVDLREVWPHEAQDFTPWLAENIEKLGEEIGLDLELRSTEASVGKFFLDILAYDLGSNGLVVIENQLEVTNHNHLGKLLTYAAGYDAYAVVWLTREFRDEHTKALNWLNQRNGEGPKFFGVVVEAWRIDNSRPAPFFKLAAMPNNWQKQNVSTRRKKGTSSALDISALDIGERYRLFFQRLIDDLRNNHKFTHARRAQAQNWYSFRSGTPGVLYIAWFTLYGNARVDVYIESGCRGVGAASVYAVLEARKESIESSLEESLLWQSGGIFQESRIGTMRDGWIDDDAHTLEELRDWMIGRLLAFKQVFGSYLGEAFLSETVFRDDLVFCPYLGELSGAGAGAWAYADSPAFCPHLAQVTG